MGIFVAWATAGGFGRFFRHPALSSGRRSLVVCRSKNRPEAGKSSVFFRFTGLVRMIFNGIAPYLKKFRILNRQIPNDLIR